MPITMLTREEQDDLIVQTYKSNEKDLFVHQLNQTRFLDMLVSLPDGEWKVRIQKLSDDTASRILEVQSIVDATEPQLPNAAAITESLGRLKLQER